MSGVCAAFLRFLIQCALCRCVSLCCVNGQAGGVGVCVAPANAAIGVDLNTEGLNVVGAVGAACEI